MNPMDLKNSNPNYWLSCLIIDKDAMAKQVRGEKDYLYEKEKGKSSPQEILYSNLSFQIKRNQKLFYFLDYSYFYDFY